MPRGYPDYQGNKYGIVTFAEWAVRHGEDVTVRVTGVNKATGTNISVRYTVDEGKVVYITTICAVCVATAEDERDLPQIGVLEILAPDYLTSKGTIGVNIGLAFPLTQPIRCVGREDFVMYLSNISGHNMNMEIVGRGYLIDEE